MRSVFKIALLGLALSAGSAWGQGAGGTTIGETITFPGGVGSTANPGADVVQVYSEVIAVPEAAWLRLYFEEVSLPPGSMVRVTSLLDGEVQELDAAAMEMWGDSSAYFNGGSVLLEVFAGPGTTGTSARLKRVALQRGGVQSVGDPGQCGICGTDDRTLRGDNWLGRIMPTGGTGSLTCPEDGGTIITAGSVISQRTGLVIQFNVPASNTNCAIVQPPVADQFPINSSSVNFQNAGAGNDWGTCRTFPNGLFQSVYDRYLQWRPVAAAAGVAGETVTVSGFGTNTTCSMNQVEQRSVGTLVAAGASTYTVSCDARGMLGAPIVNMDGAIVGVITACGTSCDNIGQRINGTSFGSAIPSCSQPTVGNDTCAGATAISLGVTSGNTGFSNPGELPCVGSNGRDVWYSFTPPCSGTYRFSTCGTTWNTVLGLYANCPSAGGAPIQCNDNACGNQSIVEGALSVGSTYYVRVGSGSTNTLGNFTLATEQLSAIEPNDTCATALPIGSAGVTGSTLCANAELPGVCGMGSAPDVWYVFEASADGNFFFDTCSSTNFDTVLALYSACGGTQLACNDNFCGTGSRVSRILAAGERVHLRVGGNGSSRGNFRVLVTPQAVLPPANNICANATPISDQSIADFLIGSGRDGASTCDGGDVGRDIWYAFTPTCNGRYYAETDGDPIDTIVSVHSACPGGPANQIACNDNFDGLGNAKAVWYQFAGTTTYIRVAARGTPGGRVVLHVFDERSNDSCAQPAQILEGSTPFNNWGAAPDGPDSPVCNFYGDPTLSSDLWYEFQATDSGTATVSTCGSGFDTKIAAYAGISCPSSAPLACNDDACGEQSVIRFPVTVGQFYLIRAGGRGGRQGCGVINMAIGPACPWIAEGCPADHNNDGSIDGDDVISFFSDWDSGVTCADANLDGSVDGDDVIVFFGAWDSGGTGVPGCA
jgi:hypothetical protein